VSLQKEITGWTRGAERARESIAERLPAAIERAQSGLARVALGTWNERIAPLVFATPDHVRTDLAALAPLVDKAIREEDATLPAEGKVSFSILTWLDLANELECCGVRLAPESWSTMRRWIPRIDAKRDHERAHYYWTTAFAALTLDEASTYRRAAGVDAIGTIPFTPKQTFQFNMQGLLRHLAAAVEAKAPLADVLPAWDDLLQSYALMRDAASIDEGTLLWIARIVFVRIGGRPLAEVAHALHQSAWSLVGLTP